MDKTYIYAWIYSVKEEKWKEIRYKFALTDLHMIENDGESA